MKILFTHSYFLYLDKKQLKSGTPYPPLAPLYAAALLRKNNYSVQLADLQFAQSPAEIKTALEEFKPDYFVVYDDSFNYLTKMCLTNMREACFEMQKIASGMGIPVIVSSSDATDHKEKYFSKGADFIIVGEAENTLLELLEALKNKSNLKNINGLAFLKEGVLIKTGARAAVRDLDELPSPAWDLVNIKPYRDTWMKHHGYFSINFVTTRGCPYKCNWCAKPVYGNRYHSHSPERIVQEIKTLQASFKFTHVWFADDIFGLKPQWLKQFSAQVEKENLHISYKIQSRADLLLQENSVADLQRSGCVEAWMGAESGSQKILDAMDKGTTVEQIHTATALLKKHQIRACFFLQFGYPGEEMEDIQKTISLVSQLQPDDIGISVSYPLPGTKFYENILSEMEEKKNWKDSDDLHLMFKSTYSPEFYRHLQRYVHYQFRLKQELTRFKNRSLRKRTALLPYYYLRKLELGKKIGKLEPKAAGIIS